MDLAFSFKITKDDKLQIYKNLTYITTLKGSNAQSIITKISESTTYEEVQIILARATGNFKRGNEKKSKSHPRNVYR